MRFADLDPRWLRVGTGDASWRRVATFAEAQGVLFDCPTCCTKNKGPIGTHSILLWSRSRSTPEETTPTGRWALEGTGVDDFTLGGEVSESNPEGKRSVVIPSCGAHFSITDGAITFHADDATVTG